MSDESNQRSVHLGGNVHTYGKEPDAPQKGENWYLVIQRSPYRTWIERHVYDSEVESTAPPLSVCAR